MRSEKKSVEFTRFFVVPSVAVSAEKVGGGGKALLAFESVGCDVSGGGLRAGLCGSSLEMLGGVEIAREDVMEVMGIDDCFWPGDYGWLVRYDGGNMELYMPDGMTEIEGDFCAPSVAVLPRSAGVNVPIVKKGHALYLLSGSGNLTALGVECSGPFCYFRDRVFYCKNGETIGYSAPGEPLEFGHSADDAGEITLMDEGGDIVALSGFGNALYAVRERSVSRLVAVGAARDFRLERIAYDGGDIFASSVAQVGGALWFAARDGIYRCEGEKCVRITAELALRGANDVTAYVGAEGYLLSYTKEGVDWCVVVAESGVCYEINGVRAIGKIGDEFSTKSSAFA